MNFEVKLVSNWCQIRGEHFASFDLSTLSYLHIAVIDITESETGFLLFVITNYLIISLQTCSGETGAVVAERLQ